MPETAHTSTSAAHRSQVLPVGVLAVGAFAIGGIATWSGSPLAWANFEHILVDLVSLAAGALAVKVASRAPASEKHTFGLARLEVLIGLGIAFALFASAAFTAFAAFNNGQRQSLTALGGVALVAAISNAAAAWSLNAGESHSLSSRANLLHLATDFASFVVTGVAVLVASQTHFFAVVSTATVVVALLVATGSVSIIRDGFRIIMEASPRGVTQVAVETALAADSRITSVHHVHLWQIGSSEMACSAHIVLVGVSSLHETQDALDAARRRVAERTGVSHVTLEAECHTCDAPSHQMNS